MIRRKLNLAVSEHPIVYGQAVDAFDESDVVDAQPTVAFPEGLEHISQIHKRARFLKIMSEQGGLGGVVLGPHITQGLRHRTQVLRSAEGLIVANAGVIQKPHVGGVGVRMVDVLHGLTPEADAALDFALGAGIPVVLAHGYPEGDPNITRSGDALRDVGVHALTVDTLRYAEVADPILSHYAQIDR